MCVFSSSVLQGVPSALLEAKWLTLTVRVRWGSTPPPSSPPCRGSWGPLTLSWGGRSRTWYRTALNLPFFSFRFILCFPYFFIFTFFLQDVPLGKASSHWEARVLQGSIMAAVLEDPPAVRIDPVTLAALQDTGWYTVDMSRAQSLVWGEGEEDKPW